VGAQGTPHIQFYIAFKKQETFCTVSKALNKEAWLFIKRGTCKQASDYCKKGKGPWTKGGLNAEDPLFGLDLSPDTIEYGVLPEEQQEAGGKATEEIWAANIELAMEGRFDEMTPSHQVLHHNRYMALADRRRKKPKNLTWKRGPNGNTPNLWIYGPAGTGKSHKARELYPNLYEKMLNKWWEDYNYEDEVLCEDVGMSHASWIGDFLKRWADIYPFRNEVKFGSKMLRPKVVIVTSNYHPKDLFPDPNVHLPLLDGRFKLMHLTEVYVPPEDRLPVQNFPIFDVTKEIFAVEDADEIPLGPYARVDGVVPLELSQNLPFSIEEESYNEEATQLFY